MKNLLKLLLLVSLTAPLSAAILTGNGTGSHDPSRMINCNGTYYIYSTGGGMKFSTDRINWSSGTSPFSSFSGSRPPKMKAVIPSDQGIWAPDVIFYNNQYYLYYSIASSTNTGTTTAVGLITSPTLNPNASNYKWTDVGVVVSAPTNVSSTGVIDPCPFIDTSNNLWLSYGSNYTQSYLNEAIYVSRLNNTTGLLLSTTNNFYPIQTGHIEASYIHYHDGYYYAFWNDGGCCSGTNSTYKIHMGRSSSVTGPYVDKSGVQNSGATIFLNSTVTMNSVIGLEHGPGHMGILSEGGIDRFTYHYYPITSGSNGGASLGEETLIWGSDGWPKAGSDFAPGTNKITSVGTGQALGIRGSSTVNGAAIEQQTYTASAYQQWTVAFTYSSGTIEDGYYSITAGNGKAMDLYQSSTADGTLIDQWTPGTGNNQRWFIEQTSDGKYRIVSRTSGDVVSIPTSSQTPNPQVARMNNGVDAQISFSSQMGWNYSVLSSTNLQSWGTPLTTLAGTGNTLTYTQSGAGMDIGRYWRLNIQQAVNSWTWNNLSTQKWNFSAP